MHTASQLLGYKYSLNKIEAIELIFTYINS